MQESGVSEKPLILASGSVYRAGLLAEAGIDFEIDPPDVDERALDYLLETSGPDLLAIRLALLKARDVAARYQDRWILAGDQVAVLDAPAGSTKETMVLLTKQPNARDAVIQLMSMSATVHQLVGGIVLLESRTGRVLVGLDHQIVEMRKYSEETARNYVTKFEPFDTAGAYRLEDQEQLDPGDKLVERVSGESPTGVLGLPIPLVRRLLAQAAASWRSPAEPS